MHIKTLPYESPIRAYEKLYRKNSLLLESQKNGRYSYIALNPHTIFKSKGNIVSVNGKRKKINPLQELSKLINKKITRKKSWPLFYSGCAGYIGYDTSCFIEKLPSTATDDLNLPDISLIFPEDILCFDHTNKTLKLYSKTKKNQKSIMRSLQQKVARNKYKPTKPRLHSNFTYTQYKKAIQKCKQYVKAGDSFQIKISQRFSCSISQDPFAIYKRLRSINPSPYASFLNFDDCVMVSCSPEHLVKVEGKHIETRPIGGTYPKNQKRKFLQDEKEKAEHRMLIDLERNDLGKICEFGSIHVNEKMKIEHYSHLLHYVSNIKGILRNDISQIDVLKAMFPGGTITGCPKIRTMEIIDEIEPVKRGPYTGSIGFFNYSNEMDLNIIIRTLIIKGEKGYIQVGGGIVADSDPKTEYEETIHKAQAIFEAL